MNVDSLNRWLTLGANIGVLVGIFLLIAELNQNSTLMRAQIFNERASQGMYEFMTVAESPELSDITSLLVESGFPEDLSAWSELTRIQKSQYRWYLRSERFRIANLLYQQTLGILEYDPGPVQAGHAIIRRYDAVGGYGGYERLERLVSEVEKLHQDAGL